MPAKFCVLGKSLGQRAAPGPHPPEHRGVLLHARAPGRRGSPAADESGGGVSTACPALDGEPLVSPAGLGDNTSTGAGNCPVMTSSPPPPSSAPAPLPTLPALQAGAGQQAGLTVKSPPATGPSLLIPEGCPDTLCSSQLPTPMLLPVLRGDQAHCTERKGRAGQGQVLRAELAVTHTPALASPQSLPGDTVHSPEAGREECGDSWGEVSVLFVF